MTSGYRKVTFLWISPAVPPLILYSTVCSEYFEMDGLRLSNLKRPVRRALLFSKPLMASILLKLSKLKGSSRGEAGSMLSILSTTGSADIFRESAESVIIETSA